PEVLDWSDGRRGLFYRPIKKQLTLRLDADVIAWFKARASDGERYQTNINRVLRDYVKKHGRSA
ncbi:MAG: BrnA antitoxin family protein, partial [Chloroflexota bacterium]